jgi:hypothetical protein
MSTRCSITGMRERHSTNSSLAVLAALLSGLRARVPPPSALRAGPPGRDTDSGKEIIVDRRKFVQFGVTAGGALLAANALGQQAQPAPAPAPARVSPKRAVFPGGQVAVTTPNGTTLPLVEKNGMKIGHLVAMPVKNTFAPGLEADCWGYNGRTPGPTIEVVEGDRVRFYVIRTRRCSCPSVRRGSSSLSRMSQAIGRCIVI